MFWKGQKATRAGADTKGEVENNQQGGVKKSQNSTNDWGVTYYKSKEKLGPCARYKLFWLGETFFGGRGHILQCMRQGPDYEALGKNNCGIGDQHVRSGGVGVLQHARIKRLNP